MKRYLTMAAVAAVAATGIGYWMSQQTSTAQLPQLVGAAQAAESGEIAEMSLGNPDAKVEVIEYASFTGPHCANFHETAFDQLKANYIDTGKIRFVYREVYFDKFGLWAATVARCGGEEKYFGISDIIYDTQKTWIADGDAATIADNLKKIGLKAGLSAEAVDACMRDEDQLKAMIATYQTNATKDEINSTPSFIIDGEKYSNMSYEDFAKILDEKLAN